jgi:uncharacterized protein (DUF58 family)
MNEMDNARISVQLPVLLDLAGAVSRLKLRHGRFDAAQSGGAVSRQKGRGMIFDESRLYQPGDDVRSIDWRVTARTGKAHSKVFKEEREQPVFIAIDYRRGMNFATRGVFKKVQAAKFAALLAWAAQQNGDRIGGQIFADNGCQELKPQTGRHAVLRLFNALLMPHLHALSDVSLDAALARLVPHAHPGSRVYVISDFRGFNTAAKQHLAKLSRHCDVALIHIFDPLESQLPSQGRYRFTDGGAEVLVDSGDTQALSRYHQQFEDKHAALEQLAKQWHWRYLSCSTADEPLTVLRQALLLT